MNAPDYDHAIEALESLIDDADHDRTCHSVREIGDSKCNCRISRNAEIIRAAAIAGSVASATAAAVEEPMSRRKPMTPEGRTYTQGVSAALGALARLYASPAKAAHIARSLGFTLATFRRAQCEAHDIAPFRRELRRLESRK